MTPSVPPLGDGHCPAPGGDVAAQLDHRVLTVALEIVEYGLGVDAYRPRNAVGRGEADDEEQT